MPKYYIVQSTIKEHMDLIRLGNMSYCHIGILHRFIKYDVEEVLINRNMDVKRYDKYGANILKENIKEFNNDKEALLWFKLN